MEDKQFEKIKGLLKSKNAYFCHGYITEDIVRGLVFNDITKYTEKQAREIAQIFWEKIKEMKE